MRTTQSSVDVTGKIGSNTPHGHSVFRACLWLLQYFCKGGSRAPCSHLLLTPFPVKGPGRTCFFSTYVNPHSPKKQS